MIEFPPPRRGIVFLTVSCIVFSLLTALFAILASRESINYKFAMYLIFSCLAFFPLPFLVYRLYSLTRANYSLDRDQLIISWGLRVERIPTADVEWVRPRDTLSSRLLLPWIHLPGAILGTRRQRDLGIVEFLASDVRKLLLVATTRRIYAISPQETSQFLQDIQKAIEMGSLSPMESQSMFPGFIVSEAWEKLINRYLWLANLFLNIGLLAWVSFMIPTLGKIPLGFLASASAGNAVPAAGLILLPAISIFLSLVGWVAGLFFYHRSDHRILAQIIWTSGVVSTILFLIAVMLLVSN